MKVIEGTNKGKTAKIDYAVAIYDENTIEIELMVMITKNEELQMEFIFIDNKFEECFWSWENLETGKESFGYGTVVKPK